MILNAASKIIERCVNNQLKAHLRRNDLLSEEQHAYQRKKSIHTALLDLDTKIADCMERKRVFGMVLLDMSAAFNLVPKKILCPKLAQIGLTPCAVKLIESYMTGRRNCTKVGGRMSKTVEVPTGIGEGSVLGPLIFLIAILETSAIMKIVKDKVMKEHPGQIDGMEMSTICFADDTTLICSAEDDIALEMLMKICSREYSIYFRSQGMKINQQKEEHYVLYSAGKKLMERNIQIDGREPASTVKLLGLTLGPRYTFDSHVSKMIQKASHRIASVRKVSKYLENQKRKEIVDSLVMSVLKFGLEWSGRNDNNLRRLQRSMNQALRLMTLKSMREPIRMMLAETKLLNMKLECAYMRMCLMRNTLMHGTSPFTCSMLTYPGPRSRSGEIRSKLLMNSKFGENAILTESLKLVNEVKLWKKKDEAGRYPGKAAFRSLSHELLKSKFKNGNLI